MDVRTHAPRRATHRTHSHAQARSKKEPPTHNHLQLQRLLRQSYYKAVELVGQGTYGNVFKCKVIHTPGSPATSEYVAVKKFKKPGTGCLIETKDEEAVLTSTIAMVSTVSTSFMASTVGPTTVPPNRTMADKCRRELAMLKLISEDGQNPHLIRLLDHFVTQTNKLCLVFEYIDMTLLDVMDEHPSGMEEKATKSIIFQILQALRQLHQTHNVMHRDVKPENVLVDRHTGIAKLCDMGFAREDTTGLMLDGENIDGNRHPGHGRGGQDEQSDDMTQYVSTRWYRAPELLLGHPRYSKSIDVWAVGCLVVEMLAGKPAFPAKNDLGVLGIVSDVLDWEGSAHGGVCIRTSKRESFMGDSGDSQAAQTAEREKARRHGAWLKGWLTLQDEDTRDFILACLRPDAKERATVDELLRHPWLATMDWLGESYERGIREAIRRTASVHEKVVACKRLRTSLLRKKKGSANFNTNTNKDATSGALPTNSKRHRQHSLMVPKANFPKQAYYTPQVTGVGGNTGQNGSIGAVYATGAAHQKNKKSNGGFWLDTPTGGAGALISPKLKPATNLSVPEESNLICTSVSHDRREKSAENSTQVPASNDKRSLAKRLLDKLKF